MSAADETWRMLAGLVEATRLVPERLRARPRSMPLTVIGGFLGAGKTTLLNHVLTGSHGARIAVLVNDFGRVNVDAALVRSRSADTIALTNGCACCSIAGDLTRALVALAQRDDPPEAVVLEASGVADPRSLAQVALANPALRLDALVTLVDAETLFTHEADAAYGGLFRAQVDAADIVVLNKRDLVSPAQFDAARTWIASRGPGRPIVTSVRGEVPVRALIGIDSARALHERPFDAGHSQRFASRVLESDEPLDEASLAAMLDAVEGDVLRAKGIVWLAGRPERRTVYQRVGRRESLTAGEPWDGERPRSQLVVITKAA
ncbi:MAG: CobW family GTP-binding protein [Betaproteobacteria bacterium]